MVTKIIFWNFYFPRKKALLCFAKLLRYAKYGRKLRTKVNARDREITVEKLAYLI